MVARKQKNVRAATVQPPLITLSMVILWVAVLVTAIAVIYSTHRSRHLYSDWQQLQQERYGLEEQWGRLLLEQSTWAAPDRVHRMALEKMNMKSPSVGELRMVDYVPAN